MLTGGTFGAGVRSDAANCVLHSKERPAQSVTVAVREEVRDYGGNLSSTTITKADAGKTVTVCPGGTVAISLDENPTTGLRWELEPGNDAALELLSSEYIAPAPGAGVGGGGRRLWTFKARKSGEVRLVLKRRRVWQKDDSDGERFEVTIGITN